MKHVDVHGKTLKEVIPGARCDELFWRFLELNEKYIFEEVIVSVGTNYLRHSDFYDIEIAQEIVNLMTAIKAQAPSSTKFTYAQILPKRGRFNKLCYMDRINFINGQIDLLLESHEIDFINYTDLGNIINVTERNVFDIISRDGTHLNRYGVKMVSWYLNEHLGWTCSY